MTKADGTLSPQRPVGYIDENGERTFKMPDDTIDIVKSAVERYTERRDKEESMEHEAVRQFAESAVADGKLTREQFDEIEDQFGGGDLSFSVGEEESEGDVMFREDEEKLEEVNEKFNEELSKFTIDNADNFTFRLGLPSEVLLAAGVENKPIVLYGNKVAAKVKKHGFDPQQLYDLPLAVAHPIAVFDNLSRKGNRSVLTELKTAQGNFLVTIDLGKGSDIDFDIVSSVFGKRGSSVVEWINKGYLKYVDKEKALNYLHLSAPIAEASNNTGLISATKIIKDFENPSIPEEKSQKSGEISFSVSSAEDAEYMSAVDDMATAERMVKEAARRAMPNSKLIKDGTFRKMWHFTDEEFTSFLPGTSKDPSGIKGIYFAPTNNGNISSRFGKGKAYFLNVTNPIVPAAEAHKQLSKRLREMQEGVTDREELAKINRRFIEETGVDGIVDWMNGWYTVLTPEQIKSADPVAYDDAGKPIPLSERFNPEKDDIRFSVGEGEIDEIKSHVNGIKRRYDMHGGAIHQVIGSREEFENMKRFVDEPAYNTIVRSYEDENAMDCYIPRLDVVIIFCEKMHDTRQAESSWSHEQTHSFWWSIPEEQRKRYGGVILDHLKNKKNDLYRHIIDDYKEDEWEEEACAYLIGKTVFEYGLDIFMSEEFGGNVEIANFANEYRNF